MLRWTSLIAVLAVLLAGCGEAPRPAAKSGTGALRTDVEPLTKRFSALGTPERVRWMSGTFGSDRAPGPSTYWIDAVITLPQSKIDELKSAHAPQATGATPDVVDGLRAELPAGTFLTGDRLDQAFAHDTWGAKAYLAADNGTLVLVATGS